MCLWYGSGEYCERYRAGTILSTDGQTGKVKHTHTSTSLSGGKTSSTYQYGFPGAMYVLRLCEHTRYVTICQTSVYQMSTTIVHGDKTRNRQRPWCLFSIVFTFYRHHWPRHIKVNAHCAPSVKLDIQMSVYSTIRLNITSPYKCTACKHDTT